MEAPSIRTQFAHHISLLTSRSEAQRRDSLAYLTTFIASRSANSALPQPLSSVLPKLYPLILDGSSGVRTQLLKLFRILSSNGLEDYVSEILPYVRAGMTHLASEIRLFAVDALSWLLDFAGTEVVSCAGGWFKTLNCFLTIMGWHAQESANWSSNRSSFGKSGSEGRPMARNLQVLTEFVKVGISLQRQESTADEEIYSGSSFPQFFVDQHLVPRKSNAFGYLNLFGLLKDDETEMLEDREDRLRVFNERFRISIDRGLEAARREGGEAGRAAANLSKMLKEIEQQQNDQ